jgi:hypothetical protein
MKTITIYSNQNQPNTNNYIYGIYTGVKWQCVELARRYMIITKNLTFPAVENAYDLFKLPYFIDNFNYKKYNYNIPKEYIKKDNEFYYLKGDIYIQIYPAVHSIETRLIYIREYNEEFVYKKYNETIKIKPKFGIISVRIL